MNVIQQEKRTLHQGSVYALCCGEMENDFFSAGSEGLIASWNLTRLAVPAAAAKLPSQVFSLFYWREKKWLLAGTMSGSVHVLDLEKKKEIFSITHHSQSVFDMAVHGEKIFLASKDGTLSVWNHEFKSPEFTAVVSNQALRCLAFSPSGTELALGCSDGNIYFLNPSTGEVNYSLAGPTSSVFCAAYLGQNVLAAGSRDAQLYVYDLASRRLLRQIKAHLYTINHLVPVLGGKYFATASRDKTIRLWQAENFELVKSLDREKYNGHANSVNRLLWIGHENSLVSTGDDRSIIVWKITD
jgi:WD40 repeat protein